MNAPINGRAQPSGPRARLASPTMATVLGALALASLVATFPLEISLHQLSSASDLLQGVTWLVFGLSFTAVGVVVARREPRNPLGWLLLAATLAIQLSSEAAAYSQLDYSFHHGALPLGHVAVLLSPAWAYGFALVPLIIVLFPDGRLGPRWRWPLRAYVAVIAVFAAGTLSVAVAAFRLRIPVDSGGNLVGLSNPSGGNAWFGPVYDIGFVSVALLAIASVLHQVRSYRRASGERRQQLKWLSTGALSCVVFLVITVVWSSAPAWVGNLFPLALTTLPVSMGVGILRYRLYEIDRLVSRTLSYAILTALLVGTFIGLIALTTNTLDISSRVGVAASTLAAAALFNPLRVRIQRVVDRRFNRARYDAEATVAAFTARLRDAVEIDAIRADLLDVVNRAVQPTHASVWIKP
jgi:histidine kinase-like protein